MNNIYNKAANILCNKYGLSAQYVNSLIEKYKLSSARNYFECRGQKVTTEFKLELLLHSFNSELFRNSEELRKSIIRKWRAEDIENAYFGYRKNNDGVLSTKIRKLTERKWTISWAREFMRNSGLPIELAGVERKNNLPCYEDVLPYVKIPNLVDFQIRLKDDLLKVIREKGDEAKCIITLPTGAGKTRIAVEAYLEYLRPHFSEGKYLIWIAQSKELCEQAIKSFQDIWQCTEFTESLRIFRFYENHEPQMEDLAVGGVVVCGINKLNEAYDSEVYKHIIENCGTCIIDEAHRAVTTMYERFYDYAEKIRGNKIFPICGLTATPGRNDNPNKLPHRFKYNLCKPVIPENYADDIQYFRELGFLAKPRHLIITTKAEYKLNFESTNNEIDLKSLEDEIEKKACKQLARDGKRNGKIIWKLLTLSDERTIVYACSLEHANNINAILTKLNLKSVVISGRTPRNERLINIEKFKSGEINFIINHSVLTTGFDAPKTDNIVICRPIFSDILYEQIIGRGLRGPKFGGTEYCNIIDFTDNLGRFGDQQSYNRFKHLWIEEHEE